MTDPFSIILNRLWSIKGIGPVLKQRIVKTILEVRDESTQIRMTRDHRIAELEIELRALRKINDSLLEELKEYRQDLAEEIGIEPMT